MHENTGFDFWLSAQDRNIIDTTPIQVLEVELCHPIPRLDLELSKSGQSYKRVIEHIRICGHPFGFVEITIDEHQLSAYDHARYIWEQLGDSINNYFSENGIPPLLNADEVGINGIQLPDHLCDSKKKNTFIPFISVIVPTRDRPEIATCLSHLVSLPYPNYEIIVVDNAPKTNSTQRLIQQNYAHIENLRYVQELRPGLDWARNCGLTYAKGEIVAFTDDDVIVDPCWLDGIAEGFGYSDDVACVTGLILPVELETDAQILFEHFYGFKRGFKRRVFDKNEHRPVDPLFPYRPTDFGTGANMAFKKDFLNLIGGFDPGLGPGTPCAGDDSYALFEVIRRGYKLVYEPRAFVRHLHRKDMASLLKQIRSYGTGITAVFLKCFSDDPKSIFEICTKIPYGLFFTLSPKSSRNSQRKAIPRELRNAEIEGLLNGPWAYIHSRLWLRKRKQETLNLAK